MDQYKKWYPWVITPIYRIKKTEIKKTEAHLGNFPNEIQQEAK